MRKPTSTLAKIKKSVELDLAFVASRSGANSASVASLKRQRAFLLRMLGTMGVRP